MLPGACIVELEGESFVQKAIDILHGHQFRGRKLVVKKDIDVNRDKTGKPFERNRMDSGRDHDDYGGSGNIIGYIGCSSTPQYNTYGLRPEVLDSLGITGPLTCRLFVANLAYEVTVYKLEEVFKLAGKIVKIELKKDEEGNSKGHGTIEMGDPRQAVQAISMLNGQKLFNRTIHVRMDNQRRDENDELCLPEGLQSIGRGLGPNGVPVQFPNASSAATGMNTMGGMSNVATNNLGLMPSNQMNATGVPAAGGVPGLGGIGMSLGLGGDRSNFGSGVGNLSQSLGLGNSATAGLANPGLMGVGLKCVCQPSSTQNSDTVIVRNLPTSYTWQNLRDLFHDIGDIRYTEMKGLGTAVIRFTTERDAQRAVGLMCGVRIEGRPIDVALY